MALAALATAPSAHAQGIRLGLRAGGAYTNLAGNIRNENTYNNKLGFMGGVVLNADLTGDGFFSIQPEVLYSQKGFENKPTEYTNTLLGVGYTEKREGKVNFNYLDVPVLARIKAGGLVLEAGPQYSYLLSANDETKLTRTPQPNGTPQTFESTDRKDVSNLKRSELGYVAGVGYQADNGLGIGLRYTGAFSDFVKADNGDTYFGGDLKNARHSAFQLSLSYLFPGK
ncbi:hypothetical protein B0919_00410 [Hymenobacter sp. CRA2]|nr:hypothetical protein B0919_00410 [Hymenobacter sp. CRA2]